jgi:hypothetical protein
MLTLARRGILARCDRHQLGQGIAGFRACRIGQPILGPDLSPLIVIVLRRGITSVPGLISLSLLPNVALVVHEQLEKLLLRHTSPESSVLLH